MFTFPGAIGKKFLEKIDYFGGISGLLFYSIKELFTLKKTGNKLVFGVIKKQILFTGYDALPIISIIALMLGFIIIIQSVTLLQYGAENLISQILIVVFMRELGPILTAIVIIGRSGSAISTEIGNMMVSHEFEAIEVMGIDPLRFIVAPRIAGMILSIMALTIYFNFIGILGGFLVASIKLTVPFTVFFNNLFSAMTTMDIMAALVKSAVFGGAISAISVYHGFKVKKSFTEVPQATTKAVVNSMIFAFVLNSIITVLFYV